MSGEMVYGENVNINGKILNVIQNMYKKYRTNVIFNNKDFPSEIGVRQGEKSISFLVCFVSK